jgi:hypothetical protein
MEGRRKELFNREMLELREPGMLFPCEKGGKANFRAV